MKVNSKRGITLITLVITIVVLLIIAGVAISIAVDANGIFSRARYAADKWNEGIEKEEDSINDMLEVVKKYSKNVPNDPQLLDGMSPIKFTLPEGETAGSMVETNVSDPDWYNYEDKKWANAKTEDGSMWVWIPRYAYRINESTQTTEVVFLQGITDNYYDEEGNLCQAKRYEREEDRSEDGTTVDTTTGFTVHPAFTNETNIDYRNGGWDRELEGIWVAKFEAGYAGGNNEAPEVATNVKYSQATIWGGAIETTEGNKEGEVTARNWQDGEYGSTPTVIKFPTFQPLTYSMNYINHNDAYLLCKELSNNSNNIYGFKGATTDTHLIKDSEWGMVSYFSKSQYGLGKTDIYINNISLNSGGAARSSTNGKTGVESVYAVTGLTEGKVEEDSTKNGSGNGQKITTKGKEGEVLSVATNNTATATDKIYKWNQLEGQKASTTGNMYGIYDLSGGLWEITPCYVANGRNMLTIYGKSIIDETEKKYVQIYKADSAKDNTSIPNDTTGSANLDAASTANYPLNKYIYGTAMGETSTAGTGSTSWYNDYASFPGLNSPFSVRGGSWYNGRFAGLFIFGCFHGNSVFYDGLRAVVVAK